MKTIYGFLYNDCIHESSWATISLHETKSGAETAMNRHRHKARRNWQKLVNSDPDKGTEAGYDLICPFGVSQDWCVKSFKLLK